MRKTDVGGLKKENLKLISEKQKLEGALEAESAKRVKIEPDMKVLRETTAKSKLVCCSGQLAFVYISSCAYFIYSHFLLVASGLGFVGILYCIFAGGR